MSRNSRLIIVIALVVVLAADLAALGYAFTRGGGEHLPRYPGRIAVRAGCGLEHMFFDGKDKKTMCLQDVFDDVSVSRNGKALAWDTRRGDAILVAGVDGANPASISVPPGISAVPSLAPDGKKVAFLHSPHDDGKYDIWVTSTTVPNAEQVTNTRNVSDVAWSPNGDRLAYIQNWSDETLEGQLSLIDADGGGARALVDGDSPDWSPDGKKIVYVHDGSIWTIDADGTDRHLLIRDGHSPAWSRDGQLVAFLRTEKCSRSICPERLYLAFADGTKPQEVGPVYPGDRRVLWLPDPFE